MEQNQVENHKGSEEELFVKNIQEKLEKKGISNIPKDFDSLVKWENNNNNNNYNSVLGFLCKNYSEIEEQNQQEEKDILSCILFLLENISRISLDDKKHLLDDSFKIALNCKTNNLLNMLFIYELWEYIDDNNKEVDLIRNSNNYEKLSKKIKYQEGVEYNTFDIINMNMKNPRTIALVKHRLTSIKYLQENKKSKPPEAHRESIKSALKNKYKIDFKEKAGNQANELVEQLPAKENHRKNNIFVIGFIIILVSLLAIFVGPKIVSLVALFCV